MDIGNKLSNTGHQVSLPSNTLSRSCSPDFLLKTPVIYVQTCLFLACRKTCAGLFLAFEKLNQAAFGLVK